MGPVYFGGPEMKMETISISNSIFISMTYSIALLEMEMETMYGNWKWK